MGAPSKLNAMARPWNSRDYLFYATPTLLPTMIRAMIAFAALVIALIPIITVIATVVAVAPVAIPPMIVFYVPSISFPVTLKKLLTIMVRCNPTSSLIRRSSPIAFMPFVMPSRRVPIAVYPQKLRPWPSWQNSNHTGLWRRSDPDSEGDLRVNNRSARQQQDGKQCCSN
jgi:hypothetical protein